MSLSKGFTKSLSNSSLALASLLSILVFAAPVFAEPATDTGAQPPAADAGPRVVDPGTPDALLRPGDIVDQFDLNMSNEDNTGTDLGERQSLGAAQDCDELSDYYAYRQDHDEVQCTRVGGPGSCQYKCRAERQYGCFSPETLVLMGDGVTSVKIDAISQGDYVWNPVAKKPVRVAKVIKGPETKPLYEIGYGPYRTHVTEKHPMVIQKNTSAAVHKTSMNSNSRGMNATVKQASMVTLDDSILGADGNFHPVNQVRQLPLKANQYVINLELDGATESIEDHLIVADGIITGDYMVQRTLETQN